MGWLVRALLITLALAASTASAQPDDGRARAKVLFEAGEKAFASNDFGAALRHFREADALAPHYVVKFNIAVCLERLGKIKASVAQYRAVVSAPDADPSKRSLAEERIRSLEPELGRLALVGQPAGAQVYVDGELFCAAPCEETIDPGRHSVKVDGRGGSHVVDIEPGKRAEIRMIVDPPRPQPHQSRWLLWAGTSALAVGIGGTIGFGLRTRALKSEYVDDPTDARRDEGLHSRLLTNVSIGLAAAGAGLVAVDLLFLRGAPEQTESSSVAVGIAPTGARVRVEF